MEPKTYINNTGYTPINNRETLVCFCESYEHNSTKWDNAGWGKYDNITINFEGEVMELPICADYYDGKSYAKLLDKATAMAINIMNVVVQLVISIIFGQVAFPTKSQKEESLATWIFTAQFVNLGFLLLLLTANFTDQEIPIIQKGLEAMFHESDTDFDQSWYNGNGLAITKAMVINAFINPIVEIGMGCVRKLLRW